MSSNWIIAYLYSAGFLACAVLEFESPRSSSKWIKWVLVIGWPLCVVISAAAGMYRGLVSSFRP